MILIFFLFLFLFFRLLENVLVLEAVSACEVTDLYGIIDVVNIFLGICELFLNLFKVLCHLLEILLFIDIV